MRPSRFPQKVRRVSTRSSGLALFPLLLTLAFAGTAGAQSQVQLGTAEPFAVLGAETVTNTGATVLNGDLGISPGAACTGFPAPCTGGGPGVVNGTIHAANTTSGGAQADLTTAYLNAAGQGTTATVGTELGGTTLPAGVYDSASTEFGITGTLTLDGRGDPNAVFIFKAGSTLVTAAENSNVNLINGAQSCNVFWQVGSSATLGTNTVFRGNILALTSIAANTGAVIDGRLLARVGEVTLQGNTVTRARCDTAGPTLRLTRVPQRCTSRNFNLRVNVNDAIGIRHTTIYLDGKRIKRSNKRFFTVPIKANRLSAGRHKIRGVSIDDAGNRRNARAGFDVCQRAAISFTG